LKAETVEGIQWDGQIRHAEKLDSCETKKNDTR